MKFFCVWNYSSKLTFLLFIVLIKNCCLATENSSELHDLKINETETGHKLFTSEQSTEIVDVTNNSINGFETITRPYNTDLFITDGYQAGEYRPNINGTIYQSELTTSSSNGAKQLKSESSTSNDFHESTTEDNVENHENVSTQSTVTSSYQTGIDERDKPRETTTVTDHNTDTNNIVLTTKDFRISTETSLKILKTTASSVVTSTDQNNTPGYRGETTILQTSFNLDQDHSPATTKLARSTKNKMNSNTHSFSIEKTKASRNRIHVTDAFIPQSRESTKPPLETSVARTTISANTMRPIDETNLLDFNETNFNSSEMYKGEKRIKIRKLGDKEDDRYWPAVVAVTVGVPAIIIIGVTIIVMHRKRKLEKARQAFSNYGYITPPREYDV